jgi:hypothetical protein
MTTKFEFFERLREHIPEPAARLIAEEMPMESGLSAKLDAFATKQDVLLTAAHLEQSIERLRSSLFRWQLMFFVPLWIGVYGTLVAILIRR